MQLPDLKEARKRTKENVLTKHFTFDDKYKNIVKNKYYFLKTYGCQMNERDSENIKAIIELMGYRSTNILEEADLVILNTCSIRENAHNKVFGYLGRAKHAKLNKPGLIVGITGCMSQEEVVVNKIVNKYKWMDFVVGTHNIESLSEVIYSSIKSKELKVNASSVEGIILEDLPSKRDNKYKAYVNIMLGCDKFCTYCIVPYTRGKQRSRDKDNILKEINTLINDDYKEITLLGQNVNAYGKDLNINYTMANLLEDVAKTGIERVRFMTSHPWDFTDEMIEVIAKYNNIMPHVHLPVQSGSNEILKLMGRRYTKESYLTLYNKLKEKVSNISITTDIIIGFPGETKVQFLDTLQLVNECNYDLAYTFIFSKRAGTPAEKMEDLISMEEKASRLKELNILINNHALLNNKKYLDKTLNVLVEGKSEKDNDYYMGYTEQNKLINFKACENLVGKIVKVKVTKAKTWSMDGELEL